MGCKTIYQKLRTPMTFMSVPIGIVVGCILVAANGDPPYSRRDIMYVGFLGELSLLAIRSISLPLIVVSIVQGVSSLSSSLTKSLCIKYAFYVIITKFICLLLGMAIALALVPRDPWLGKNTVDGIVICDQYEDWFRLLLPQNVISMFIRSETTYSLTSDWRVVLSRFVKGTNYVGLILISILSGIVLRMMANKSEDMLEVIHCMLRVLLEILRWVLGVLPICMLFDVASQIMALDLSKVNPNFYIMYLTAIAIGLSFLLIIYPLIYLAILRKNPFKFMISLGKTIATGFAASSTIAALQYSVDCMEKNNLIDKRFTRTLIPIGNTIHLSGKTLQGVVLAVFVANSSNVYLHELDYFTILILGFLASFVVGPLPIKYKLGSMILLNGIGMQHADLTPILMLDWIVGRLTTVVDIVGDCVGVAIMAHLHGDVEADAVQA